MSEERLVQAFFFNNPDNYPPIINGTRLLAKAGWKVELYCRDDGKRWNVAYPDEVRVQRIKQEGSGSWRNYFSFCREAMRRGNKQASVFVGHDMHGLVPARLLALRYRRPLVYHCYDYSGDGYAPTAGSRLLETFQFAFARTADLMTVPDKGLADLVAEELRLKQKPVVMVNSPIDSLERGGALRQALKDRGREFERIVFRQGRIGRGHGIETTIRSIPSWANPNWGFVVMGIGEASYCQSLIELASSIGVEDQFVTLPPVAYDRVSGFTRDADVGHALYEPIHVNNLNISGACKIQEYMASGLPLLVSDRASLKTLVETLGCGVVADDSSPESVAAAINGLLGDAIQAREMGAAAAQAFEARFRFEFQFRPVLETIEALAH